METESLTELGRYRSIMSKLVAGLIVLAKQMETCFPAPVGQAESGQQDVVREDGYDGLRTVCAHLLRRMRFHAVAVLRANEACNVHSLGVQMRPALECIGQLALVMQKPILDPKKGLASVLSYMHADYYGTTIRATKGKIGPDQLLKHLAFARQKSKEYASRVAGGDLQFDEDTNGQYGRRHRHIDKVAELVDGKNWYRYLSKHFCHGNPADVRDTWDGGVVSTDTTRDEVVCAWMMDYLANQMAVMIFYAALCPSDRQVGEDRVNDALAQLEGIRAKTKKHRDLAILEAENANMHGGSA